VLLLAMPRHGFGLEVRQKFTCPTLTNNFVLDGLHRKVYLASVNRIYQLYSNLTQEIEEETGPVKDNLLCHAPQLPQAQCDHPKVLTNNYNKLLQLDPEQKVIVVCGSVFQGFCQLRKMGNISEVAVTFPPPSLSKNTVFPSMLNIAANHPNASTLGLIFKKPNGDTKLLVGATYTGVGTQFFPKNHSKEDLRFENTPEIAIRSLNINDLPKLFTYDINPSEDNVFKIKQDAKPKNRLSFVHAFIQKSYSYIAMNNDAKLGDKESHPNSILARICLENKNRKKSPPETKKLTESYIQMGLQCGSNGNVFNRLVSVFAAKELLFGVFEKSNREAALCVFTFAFIEDSIRNARKKCFEKQEGANPTSVEEVMVLDSVIQGTGPSCTSKNIQLQSEQLDCGAAHLQHPLAIKRPLKETPVFSCRGLTSVAVASVSNHTVVFLGTAGGRLLKLNLNSSMDVLSRRWISVAPGESVHHVMNFDPTDESYLYVMTSYQLENVEMMMCQVVSICSVCVGGCGEVPATCSLTCRCSLQQDCPNSILPNFWTGLSDGVEQCPSLNFSNSEISHTKIIEFIGIIITGTIPTLLGMDVYCNYDDSVSTKATVAEGSSGLSVITCPFLPKDKYPPFPANQDHVILPTAVRVNGRNIVWGNLTIYDCQRTGVVNPKTACSSCLRTKWKCYWCISKHSCMRNSSDCDNPVLMNFAACPQISPSYLTPAPTGETQNIVVPLTNSDAIQESTLECDFGVDRTFEAKWINVSAVHCTDVQLQTANKSQQYPVNLRLKGNPGKFIDSPQTMTVEVYNCASGSSDCSQCWGRVDLGHHCTWHEITSSCGLSTGKGQTSDACPPPEIRKIEPLAGPLEGGTLLTIRGRNLGRRFSDISNTTRIGGVSCRPLPERYLVSEEIVCVTGETPRAFAGAVTVQVSREGKSKEKFSYLVPEIHSLSPSFGPKAGGTKVVIHGRNLDIGSEVQVLVNSTKRCTDLVEIATCTAESGSMISPFLVCIFYFSDCTFTDLLKFFNPQPPLITNAGTQHRSQSGGRIITVAGQQFELVQDISMVVETPEKKEVTCEVQSSTVVTCPSPAASHVTQGSVLAMVQFYINGKPYVDESSTPDSFQDTEVSPPFSKFSLEYHRDPQFFTAKKEKWIKHHHGEPLTLVINKEPDDLELEQDEYQVKVGPVPCEINFIKDDKVIHCTVNGTLNVAERNLPVTVQVGKYNRTIAMVHLGGSETAIIVSIVVCSILLLMSIVALGVFCTKSRRAERYWQKTLLQMEEMESQIREEIRKGFAELQTDMTDLTKELNRSQGIPFLEYKDFVTRTFFPKPSWDYEERYMQLFPQTKPEVAGPVSETHPLLLGEWKVPESSRLNVEEGITLFSTLLNNKHFLITFVHALEQQKDFAVRDRCNLASLLTIALHGKLEYYTSIMKDLLVDLIDASASKNPKLMLRRTESVVEKMLSNWMAVCMYSYLKETVGEPFFLLLCAIKQQINKGSIDALTGKARYTLNEEWLLRENIEARPLNLNVSFQGLGMDSLTIRVMDTDSISQVKEKILDVFYKNVPYSQWPREEDVDLEWFPSNNKSCILRDLDDTSLMEDNRKKLNTAAHYKIPDGAYLAMSLKDKKDSSLGRVKDLDTEKYFHLVIPNDDLAETKRSHRQSHRKKVLPEIYLTRLLSTKGTLQKFLDDLFKAILCITGDKPPLAIKYFFDFLEEQAEKRGITDPDTLHIWKTNRFFLLFWPHFFFFFCCITYCGACISIRGGAFLSLSSVSCLLAPQDSPTNKLLYAKEIPKYKKSVQRYYRHIQDMTALSEQEMNAHLAEESRKYRNEFNTSFAMTEIYKYAKRYRSQIVSALEANPLTKRTQLQHKFDQVIALMEDNIYECCSEA
uniref:Plexin D1 n=1 Tax=Latimeria chalumnae TaxID=7897 RepID=H3AVW2_LATCH